ncbi:hypothetical protein A3C89_03840 [Candidatus Kaiserbacteria bacterium RIFCSPHIGHO2_02_FULL_50_50]|uniref:CARDB domain-containing protein n=1 Tax=Candidatus Kaiserbacteria bacterium RIFCSPHIGHO2_02_FULL_50_50 TaxID=1798492 RepID=A0A1F6DG09_9BACT|nr:MAG: hypothetical protein A3C89_03840 [Candidatus Kaiserbacteria bacterium RIFCSPHIGHO2_02_FULL_50_50]OGG88809.1 MAG: hypothetical protein A3G62_03890 [Candidatus Kaiserbacteria bacterium RIFCSPLOWO2_12_FULL_50_10]
MKYTGLQIVGLFVAVILALIAAVVIVDMLVRAVGYGAVALDSITQREQPVVVLEDEADVRGAAVLALASDTEDEQVSSKYAAPEATVASRETTRVATAAPAKAVPRYSNAVMSFHAFGTTWRGSFVPRSSIERSDIPAIRAMVYNNGNAATNAWTFSCNWEGAVTTTRQAPLGAGERAFAVCTTGGLSRGTHDVTLIYQETGKAAQVQTVSVRVD